MVYLVCDHTMNTQILITLNQSYPNVSDEGNKLIPCFSFPGFQTPQKSTNSSLRNLCLANKELQSGQ
ncbi:MAG: hypothetical protein FD179_163 [Erysipelotrichaceae bacterium]|nr:MAG: hypothetical protein FD179_163 [Erysipelotrichaceae bacterium]